MGQAVVAELVAEVCSVEAVSGLQASPTDLPRDGDPLVNLETT